jgi:threonine dehydrogenase-like Zn-dependent dehydrogenase
MGDVPAPQFRGPADAIVRIDTTMICGTDLHILKATFRG